jgi:hypothetical protein
LLAALTQGSQISLVAPSFATTNSAGDAIAADVAGTTAAGGTATAVNVPVSLTFLRQNFPIWHRVTVHTSDMLLETAFHNVGAAWLDVDDAIAWDQMVREELATTYAAYVAGQEVLPEAVQRFPEQGE